MLLAILVRGEVEYNMGREREREREVVEQRDHVEGNRHDV